MKGTNRMLFKNIQYKKFIMENLIKMWYIVKRYTERSKINV